MKLTTTKYRLPFPDEVLEDMVKNGGDLCSPPLFFEAKIPLRNDEQAYGENSVTSFYFSFSRDVPIAAARTGRVVDRRISQRSSIFQNKHRTNYVLLDHGDGTYAKYVHVFPQVQQDAIIEAGEKIGMLGGYKKKIGSHLHLFIVRKRWGFFPPWPALRSIEICPEQKDIHFPD